MIRINSSLDAEMFLDMQLLAMTTVKSFNVNVQIFAQYIFSHILHGAVDARKYDVSEKMNHCRSNRNTY